MPAKEQLEIQSWQCCCWGVNMTLCYRACTQCFERLQFIFRIKLSTKIGS